MRPRHRLPCLVAALVAATVIVAAPLRAQAALEVRAHVVAARPLGAPVTEAGPPRVVRRLTGRADLVAPLALGMTAGRRTLTVRAESPLERGVRVLVETPAGTRSLDDAPLTLELPGGDPGPAELRFRLVGPAVREGVRVPLAVALVAQDADATGEARWRVVLAP